MEIIYNDSLHTKKYKINNVYRLIFTNCFALLIINTNNHTCSLFKRYFVLNRSHYFINYTHNLKFDGKTYRIGQIIDAFF